MDFPGFSPEDFLYFLDDDRFARVEYIRDVLHPRLRDLGLELAEELGRQLGVEFRAQLRSGRWWKTPWATWTSLVLPEERHRSDNRRPRLSVFVSEEECLVGYMQNVWRPRWKTLAKRPEGLVQAIDKAASGRPKLQLALVHWEKNAQKQWERRTTVCTTAAELLALAAEWGQDFVLVGHVYPFPQQVKLLSSPAFAGKAVAALKKAWPVYRYAFEQTEGE
ncbi:MAG: hypothetical protein FJX74_25905 [Armatimonadetes bacterium]|nr:hypothetical protein [Armatimonadota bacterium]